MLMASLRMRWKNEETLIKWLQGMLASPVQSLAKVYIGTKVLF